MRPLLAATLLAALPLTAAAEPIPVGKAKLTATVGGISLDVFTYKPAKFAAGPLILVFHGVLRNADEYRDHAAGMADRYGAVVAAPLFDRERFPTDKYQHGGLLGPDRKPRPPADWTWALVPKLADELRRGDGAPDRPYYLIGHSGGGQFLARLSGFADSGAARVVAANAGTHLFPTRDEAFPYGFGGLPNDLGGDAALKRYLGRPLTLYQGTADVIQDEDFAVSPPAMKQGESRYGRGKAVFAAGKALAEANGWPFAWRLVEAPGVGHDHEKMFDAPAAAEALFGPAGR